MGEHRAGERESLDSQQSRAAIEALERDGFVHLPGVLGSDEVAQLRSGIDRIYEDSAFESNRYNDHIVVRLFETHRVFEEMLTREPIISLVEAALGEDCHLIAENALRNSRKHRIADFHVDDLLIFPVADGMERHDPRLTLPLHVLGVQIPLTDVEAVEFGPTQYVPGSQNSGRHPNDGLCPSFEGRGPTTIFARAGDIYLHNGQCWHRGAPNVSPRTRYLFQLTYARRWVSQRFYPFVNYRVPAHVVEGADERRRRVLGMHPMGDYG